MQLQIFKYQTEEEQKMNELTTIEIEGDIWFVATDVTRVLGYSNGRNTIAR
jgi:prophage antirepressor-like protein